MLEETSLSFSKSLQVCLHYCIEGSLGIILMVYVVYARGYVPYDFFEREIMRSYYQQT